MVSIESLIATVVGPLIAHPEELTIRIEESDEFLEYHLVLNPADIGRVIGRKGRTISAIRTIVYSVPTQGKKTRIIIDENAE